MVVVAIEFSNSKYRLCRAGPTANFQLWLLSPANNPDFYNLHSLQRSARFMEGTFLRTCVFYDGRIYIQVSTALRHGPPSKLHWKSLVDHLQSHCHWLPCLSGCYGRRFGTEAAILSPSVNNSAAFRYHMVFGDVSTFI